MGVERLVLRVHLELGSGYRGALRSSVGIHRSRGQLLLKSLEKLLEHLVVPKLVRRTGVYSLSGPTATPSPFE